MQYSDAITEAAFAGYDPYNSLDKLEDILFQFAYESQRYWVPSDYDEDMDWWHEPSDY